MNQKVTTIKPKKGLAKLNLKEVYRYRELLYALTLRDIKVRYKQTLIGGLWAIIQPFVTMIVFTIFFGAIAKVPSEGIPYAVFSYSGLLLWTYFSSALSAASSSLINNAPMISKIYFPRILIPISTTLGGILDYLIAFVIMFGLMFYYGFLPSIQMILIPLILIFTWLLSLGLGLWLAAINVKYRDVRYAVPFFIQLLIFITPVIYPSSLAGKYSWILSLNPMSGFINAHRSLILGHQSLNLPEIGLSMILTIAIFISGMIYFKYVEKYFADII